MSKISFEGIGQQVATFEAAAGVTAGHVVKMSDNGKVSKCSEGDDFCGVVLNVRGGCAGVQLRGFVRPQRYDDSRRFLLRRQRLMAFFGFGHILHCGGADRRRVLLLLHLDCRFGISHWSRRLLSAKT